MSKTMAETVEVWEEKDIKDFCSDFLNLDLDNVTDSVSRAVSDFEEEMIEKGYTHLEARIMGEGVDYFLEQFIGNLNWLKDND